MFLVISNDTLNVSSMPSSAENKLNGSIMLSVVCTSRVRSLQKDDLGLPESEGQRLNFLCLNVT